LSLVQRNLKAQPGDCCVFCSYGDVHCPSVQEQDSAGRDEGNRRRDT